MSPSIFFDGAIPFEDPDDYITFFKDRFGSGSWQCQLFNIAEEKEERMMTCTFDDQDL
jgi:hypothetical protein